MADTRRVSPSLQNRPYVLALSLLLGTAQRYRTGASLHSCTVTRHCRSRAYGFFVALAPVLDLLLCAKHLFVAAKVETPATRGYVPGRGKAPASTLGRGKLNRAGSEAI